MKKLLYSLMATSLIVVATNSSFAQEVKERKRAELHLIKTEKVRTDLKVANKKVVNKDVHQIERKNIEKPRPTKARLKLNTQPARIEIKREK